MSKNRFGKFWNFGPWWPQFWPEPKNDRNYFEMIFRELSNAVFRFSLRRPGAEIMGGGRSNAPPPSRRWKIQRPSRARVNPRPAGGGAFERPPPLRFFEDSKKTAARSAAGFSPTLSPIFSATFVKISTHAMWGQVTRSGQVTQLQNNFPIAPRLQCFRESYETFGIWWGHQCLQNVYLGFWYRWPQVRSFLRPL